MVMRSLISRRDLLREHRTTVQVLDEFACGRTASLYTRTDDAGAPFSVADDTPRAALRVKLKA